MKKILILSLSLLLVTFFNVFAQTYTEMEEYKEGVQYYDEGVSEHDEGQYDSSYSLGELAHEKLDLVLASVSAALFEAYKNNASAAKAEADANLAKAKSVGASTTTAQTAYDTASKAHALIGTFEDDTTDAQAKIDAANKIMSDLPSGAENNLEIAKKKHETLLSSGTITEGDDTDQQVATLLTEAEELLSAEGDNNSQAQAQAKIDSANSIMREASGQSGLVATRAELSDAKKRHKNLSNYDDVVEGDDTDQQIATLLAEAERLLSEADTALDQESQNYKNTISGYTEASTLASTSYDNYIKEKTSETQKLISDATSKYNALLKSGVIQKGDSNDTAVSAAIAKANEALKNNDFAAAQSSINSAMSTMTSAESANASKVTQAQSALDAAKKKYENLLSSGVITKNDDYDKKISAALTAAASAIAKNDFTTSASKVAEANSLMSEAEANKQKDLAATKSELDAAKKKYEDLLASGAIEKDSDTDKQISDLLAEAEKLLAAGDTAGAKAKIEAAEKMMSELSSSTQNALDAAKKKYEDLLASGAIEKGSDLDKQISDLLAEAERLLAAGDTAGAQEKIDAANRLLDAAASDRDLAAVTASILDQLRKIRDMVRELVASGKIDVNGPEVQKINTIINRMIDLLSSGDLTEESISQAQEHLDELMETVDGVVAEANASEGGGRRVVNTLPRYYVVRNADSLWRIAQYSFIYGDSIYWETLYNANISLLVDRNNPHMILPGQLIEIPSLDGEEREGVYSPDVEYVIEN